MPVKSTQNLLVYPMHTNIADITGRTEHDYKINYKSKLKEYFFHLYFFLLHAVLK